VQQKQRRYSLNAFRRESSGRLIQHAKVIFQIALRIEPNEMFWQGAAWIRKNHPMYFVANS
jgi:hypothetical protein